MSKYTIMIFFFANRPSTTLNLGKSMLQLQSWQLTITFHNIPKGRRKDDFRQVIAEIDVLLFLRGSARIGARNAYATDDRPLRISAQIT